MQSTECLQGSESIRASCVQLCRATHLTLTCTVLHEERVDPFAEVGGTDFVGDDSHVLEHDGCSLLHQHLGDRPEAVVHGEEQRRLAVPAGRRVGAGVEHLGVDIGLCLRRSGECEGQVRAVGRQGGGRVRRRGNWRVREGEVGGSKSGRVARVRASHG